MLNFIVQMIPIERDFCDFLHKVQADTKEITDKESRFLEVCAKVVNSKYEDTLDKYVYQSITDRFLNFNGKVIPVLELLKWCCFNNIVIEACFSSHKHYLCTKEETFNILADLQMNDPACCIYYMDDYD